MANYVLPQNPMYATATGIRRAIGTNTQSTNDDDIILWFAEQASRAIDDYTNRRFFPRYQTFLVDWPGNSFTMDLPDDLITLVTLTNGNGATIPITDPTTGTTNIYFYRQDMFPRHQIQLGWNSGKVWLFVGTPQQAISINALWGYPAYEQTGTWNITTTATVQDTGSQNANQGTLLTQTGVFQVGETVYIDTEFELIQSITTGSPNDTLTVFRGACGSTAAAHTNGTVINKVIYHPDIVHSLYRLAAYYYRQKDVSTFDSIGIQQMGQLIVPMSMPQDVKAILNRFRRENVLNR